MDFRLTDDQSLLVQSLEEQLKRDAPESLIARLDEDHQFPAGPWRALAESGILGIGIPEEYGGTPADIMTMTLVCETLGKMAFPLGIIYGLGIITIRDILQFGSDQIKQMVLPGFVQGDAPVALGITEPQAGSDSAAIRASARVEGDSVVLNGQKMYTTLAGQACYVLFLTRDDQVSNPYDGISMWLLPMDTPGVRITPIRKVGWWTIPSYELSVENACIPLANLVGTANRGWQQLMANFEVERLGLCASSTGAAEAAFEDASRYANQRVQFGRAIGENQAIQHKITDMAVKIENMRNFIYKVAWMMDQNQPVRTEHALCKLYVAQASFEVIDDGMQILGGLGYTMEHRVQRLWRDIRLMRIGGGTDEIMYNIAGPQLLRRAGK